MSEYDEAPKPSETQPTKEPQTSGKPKPQSWLLDTPQQTGSVIDSARTPDANAVHQLVSSPQNEADTKKHDPTDVHRDELRMRVAGMSLRAAQHWLDAAGDLVSAASDRRPDPRYRDSVAATADKSIPFLKEAVEVIRDGGDTFKDSTLWPQALETERAFWRARGLGAPLIEVDLELRQVLKLLVAPAPTTLKHTNLGQDALHSKGDLEGVLELVTLESNQLFDRLAQEGFYEAPFREVASTLKQHLLHAHHLLDGRGATQSRTIVKTATDSVARVRRWISGRPGTGRVKDTMEELTEASNALHIDVKLPPVQSMDEPRLPRDEAEEERKENREITASSVKLQNAFETMMTGFKVGIDQFASISRLTKVPATPSLFRQFLLSALTAFGGNFGAGIAVEFVENLALTFGKELSKETLEFLKSSVSDTLQPMMPTWVAAGMKSISNEDEKNPNQVERERQAFIQLITTAQSGSVEAFKNSVADMIAQQRLTSRDVDLIRESAASSAMKARMAENTYQKAAHGFAKYQLSKALSSTNGVTSMQEYFPTIGEGGGAGAQPKSKVGNTGVGKLTLLITPGKGVDIEKFEVVGMNDDMARAVAENAGRRLERLDLPMEVYCYLNTSERTLLMMLAVDEKLTVRDTVTPPQGNEYCRDFYASPERLWLFVKSNARNRIPESATKVTDREEK